MRYNAVLFAPDGDHVTDFKRDTIQEVIDELEDMGSRWIFYPLAVVVKDNIVVSCPDIILEQLIPGIIGMTIKELSESIKLNQDSIIAWFSI